MQEENLTNTNFDIKIGITYIRQSLFGGIDKLIIPPPNKKVKYRLIKL